MTAETSSTTPTKVREAEQAVAAIRDGDTVACVGVIGWLTPDRLLQAVRERFEAQGSPRDLTFLFPVGTGDAMGIPGMDHVAQPDLMKRVIAGSYINPRHPVTGERPALMRLIRDDLVEAYSWPIGATMQWLREVARRSPGYVTRVGVGSYIDPRQGGGRFTARATEDLVELVTLGGEEHLYYPTWPVDVGLIRATSADEYGNLSFEDEPLTSSALGVAMAVKASGGTVIAQVRRVVGRRSLPAAAMRVPGSLVDSVVVVPDQPMTTDVAFEPGYLGGPVTLDGQLPTVPFDASKIVARRAARPVRPRTMTIFGFGASSDVPAVMVEDGLITEATIDDYEFTTEHGSFNGLVMSGWQFSANLFPDAVIDGISQFDYIGGGNCPMALLAFAELDRDGNVNVSRFGSANPGAGGFIDIARNATELVFTGTFTTGGLKVSGSADGLTVEAEGSAVKFVDRVQHITYPAGRGVREWGQKATIVTERAVFDLTADGLVLAEVAPGVDVRRDVLDRMAFAPARILDPLPLMDTRLFAER